jgi:hypothetical protein
MEVIVKKTYEDMSKLAARMIAEMYATAGSPGWSGRGGA